MTQPDIANIYERVKDVPYIGGIIALAEDVPGDYKEKITTIIDFFESGCNPPWMVYFETLLPALKDAVLILLEFDQWDVARAYLRPAGLRSRKRFRNGRKKKGKLPEIPEFGELIGKRIPGRKIVSKRYVFAAERYFWLVDGVLQRALWYWLVVDLVIETAYQWASNLLASRACSCFEDTGFAVSSPQQSWGAHPEWRTLAMVQGDKGDYPFEWKNSYAQLDRFNARMNAAGVVRPFLPDTTLKLTIGISDRPAAEPNLDQIFLWITPGSPPQDWIVSAPLPGPGRYYITYRTEGEGSLVMTDLVAYGRLQCPEQAKE